MPAYECSFEDGLKRYDESLDRAEAEVIKLGLYVKPRPMLDGKQAEMPEIPHDLGQCSLSELEFLIGQLTKWHSYAIGQKIIARNQRNVAAEKKCFAWKRIRRLKNGTVSDKDDETGTDIRYIDVEAHYQYCDAKYSFLDGMCESLKREVETVSRVFEMMRERRGVEGTHVGVERRAVGVERTARHDALAAVFRSGRRKS